jgi:hypothetical protein
VWLHTHDANEPSCSRAVSSHDLERNFGIGSRKLSSKHKNPVTLTTDELGEALMETVKQMTPAEKAKLRDELRADLVCSKQRLRDMPCSEVKH